MGSTFPDYYSILGVTSTATPAQVKSAYYKRSLEAHPDRIKSLSPEVKRAATEEFQSIADAYYSEFDRIWSVVLGSIVYSIYSEGKAD